MTWGHRTNEPALISDFAQRAVYDYNVRKLRDRLEQRFSWRWPVAWRFTYEAEPEACDLIAESHEYALPMPAV